MKSDLVVQLARAALEGRADAVHQTIVQISDDEHAKGHDRLAQQLKLLARRPGAASAPSPRFPEPFRQPSPAPVWRNATDSKEWAVELPSDRLDSLTLSDSTLGQLRRAINDLLHEERLRNWGVTEATRLLLHGPPGTGKTMAARAIAGEAQRSLIVVHLDQVMSSYLGETAKNVGAAFEQAAQQQAIIFLDEIDALAKSRDDGQDVGELKRTVNSILQILDRTKNTVPVIAATNHARILDSAIWRRFSGIIEFPRPDLEQRQSILAALFKQVPAAPTVWTTSKLAGVTPGFTGSDLRRFVMNATRTALHSGSNAVQDDHLLSSLHESIRMVHGREIPLPLLEEIGRVTALSQKGHGYRKIAAEMGYASINTVAQRMKALPLLQDDHANRVRSHRDSGQRKAGRRTKAAQRRG